MITFHCDLQSYPWLLHGLHLGETNLSPVKTHIIFTLSSVREDSTSPILFLIFRDLYRPYVNAVAGVVTSPDLPLLTLPELVALRALSEWVENQALAGYARGVFEKLMMRQACAPDMQRAFTSGQYGGEELTTTWWTLNRTIYRDTMLHSLEDALIMGTFIDREGYDRLAQKNEVFGYAWKILNA